jgi:hypothetical protein
MTDRSGLIDTAHVDRLSTWTELDYVTEKRGSNERCSQLAWPQLQPSSCVAARAAFSQ